MFGDAESENEAKMRYSDHVNYPIETSIDLKRCIVILHDMEV